MQYRMECTCGHAMYAGADTQEEAVEKLKAMMTQEAVNAHFAQDHKGQPVPSASDVQASLKVQPVAEGLKLNLPKVTAAA